WLSTTVASRYEQLTIVEPGSEITASQTDILDENHPLIEAAIRWVKANRFAREDDNRLAYVLTSAISEPDLLVTFLIQLRDGAGQQQERLEVVRVTQKGDVSTDREQDLLLMDITSEGNVEPSTLTGLFSDWWEDARQATEQEAQRRSHVWRQDVIAIQNLTQSQFLRELDHWNNATRNAIQERYMKQLGLFDRSDLPPAAKRKLRQHEERYRERRDQLERRMHFDPPVVEPIGVLLRVPASSIRRNGD
ncbi:hypothetical protein ACFL5M_04165, partial [Candidatus Neomarinimicrobiota bacterium]